MGPAQRMKKTNLVSIDIHNPLQLTGFVQHYPWGKPANQSLVAKYGGVDQGDKPCAELWFGTHPKGPTTVASGEARCELRTLIEQSPEAVLGREVQRRFGSCLPFLFKVLSINEALSIQAHPSKVSNPHGNAPHIPQEFWSDHAGYLHWKDPSNYPDANHKPEIAVALSTLSLLHGFKPVDKLLATLSQIPELAALVGSDNIARLKDCSHDATQAKAIVRDMYQAVVLSTPEQRTEQMGAFAQRLRSGIAGISWEREHLEKMFATYGPQDVGIPTSLLMNWTQVPAGSAVYMGPNELHAYLEGDIIECMATSDNVVRAGLTPKFQDTLELLAMADVVPGETKVLTPRALAGSGIASVYETPADEFQVFRVAGLDGASEQFSHASPSFVICTTGALELETNSRTMVFREGQVALIPAAAGAFSLTLREGEGFVVTVPTK